MSCGFKLKLSHHNNILLANIYFQSKICSHIQLTIVQSSFGCLCIQQSQLQYETAKNMLSV